MEMSEFVGKLRADLVSITRFAGDDVTRAAELLTEALDSSVRLTLLDVMSAAAADITARLGDTVVEVRLADGEPTFVVTSAPAETDYEPSAPAGAADAEPGTARLTLRLPDALKTRVEAAAARDGVSVNTWLVRAAGRSLEADGRGRSTPGRRGTGQRITGFARS
ncbi:MAG TPA: toxin-antitoxin system HicB family antitoxin [Streptosporangiaceae bacterium]|nr:toxin-antitoxin system HicB family antitoxin [Streptosporangiaceae bacterium]